MPEAILTIGGRKVKITGESKEDILQRAETYKNQQGGSFGVDKGFSKAKEIKQKRPFEEAMPSSGQIVGGLAGGMAGSVIGKPYVGAAIGGTIGRTGGLIKEEESRMMREEPSKAKILRTVNMASKFASPTTPLISSIATGATTLAMMTPEQKKKLGKEILKTGAIESITGGLTKGVSWAGAKLGQGVMNEVLGKRVAERGTERGWKTLLDKKFYQGRIPQEVAEKSSNFFKRASQSSGKIVKKEINNLASKEPKKAFINISSIKNEIKDILPESGNPKDLLSEFASPAQKNRIQTITNKVLKLKGDFRRIDTLWNLRKEIDKDIYRLNWNDDALNYLQKLRTSLNKPIKSASPEIAEAFDKYALVKKAEDKLFRNFEAIEGGGDIYATKLESYVKNLLSTSNDETIRLLKDIDAINKADDKVIDELLDLAAAESLDKGIPDISMFGKIAGGLLGGRKLLPRAAMVAQSPITKGIARTVGRTVPTAISESYEEQ